MARQELRKSDFKIGCFHGKLDASTDEAKLRNELYLTGNLRIIISKSQSINIRLLAYELPLEKENSRGRCLDLLGYDDKWQLFVIELKDGDSKEPIDEVLKQVNEYAEDIEYMKADIAREVSEKFFYPSTSFRAEVGKVILAPRSFYIKQGVSEKHRYEQTKTYICSFGGLQYEGHTPPILEKCGSKGYVSLKVENK